ncbi:hypothetical protein WA026_002865 [Henosepilachna vigintioctopunctata]|uniref:PurE domain-containing protein n=1 Tax=Henosepilachna vigintioctopunctata TaxID=420089 RepID=A0AAW1TLK4_9CUCU
MGSPSDKEHCEKIENHCSSFGLHTAMRVTSAHKGTEETLNIVRYYESLGMKIVFIAVAGRSNGLGPVVSGNSAYPVINCPPLNSNNVDKDIWSSLNVPSGLGCSTVVYPETAALTAAQMLGLENYIIWGRIKSKQLDNYISLTRCDKSLAGEKSSKKRNPVSSSTDASSCTEHLGTNIEGFNIEGQYHKTLEKVEKKCSCNVHVFSDESDIETKMYNDERLMKTLNEHSEYILIDETAHESNDDMCRKEEMPVSSSKDASSCTEHLGTNIEGFNIEGQYHKTLEKVEKKCRCNVHVFSDESDIETKMYNDERLMKTLNEHSEYILIDETAHESNDDMCRKEEMPVSSSTDASSCTEHLANIEGQYHKTLEKVEKKCRCNVHVFSDKSDIETKMSIDESSIKTVNEHSECILIDETAHESNDDMCRKEEMSVPSSSGDSNHLDDSTSTGQNCSPKEYIIKMPEHQEPEVTAQEIL